MPNVRGADVIVDALVAEGVTTIFSLSGNQIMPIYDALVGRSIRLVHVRHEAAAVYMAEAHAQITGQVGVALLTAGAGYANALGAMTVARASETPIVVLTGDAPDRETGFGGFQEMNQVGAARALIGRSMILNKATHLAAGISSAFAEARAGRPGPVHVALPFDIVGDSAPAQTAAAVAPSARAIDARDISAVSRFLADAARPLILAGPTFARGRGRDAFTALCEQSGVAGRALESPRGLKDPRGGAFPEVMAKADSILLLGKALDFMTGFGRAPAIDPACRFAQVDADQLILDRECATLGTRLRLSVLAEPVAFARALAGGVQTNASQQKWRAEAEAAIAYRPASWSTLPRTAPIHAAVLCSEVTRTLAETTGPVLVIDGGEIGQWAMACLDAPTRVINGPSGNIGASIPYAIAASAADRRPVVAVLGDGTAGFHLMEFETAIREQLPFVAIIGNDARWNAEHQIQVRDYGADRAHGCMLTAARYDQVVAALGGYGELVTDVADIKPALTRALASGKPACLNVMIRPEPAPTIRRA